MTRWLSEALGAVEPQFRHGLRKLEAANGHPNTDIQVSVKVQQATQAKLRELGLDPADTTAAELYHVLLERVKLDDQQLVRSLRWQAAHHISAEANTIDGMAYVLKQASSGRRAFALKPVRLKALLKTQPPKKAMKQLGYRSLESFLKHESSGSALAAAWLVEGASWQKHLLDQYKKLQPRDFEVRPIAIIQPTGKRWQTLAAKTVADQHHNLLSFKELGTLVLLPFNDDMPAGATTISLALALHELNEIQAASTFLKLSQVRANFGTVVQTVATDEPRLSSKVLDQPVPWHLVQRFYARTADAFREAIFEPHIQAEDMSWRSVEEQLTALEPRFNFWQESGHLGLLHNHQPVSLNLLDAALNYCNGRNFEQRVTHYFRRSLWHELFLHYLKHDTVEQTVLAELQPELATELAEA